MRKRVNLATVEGADNGIVDSKQERRPVSGPRELDIYFCSPGVLSLFLKF